MSFDSSFNPKVHTPKERIPGHSALLEENEETKREFPFESEEVDSEEKANSQYRIEEETIDWELMDPEVNYFTISLITSIFFRQSIQIIPPKPKWPQFPLISTIWKKANAKRLKSWQNKAEEPLVAPLL